MTSDVNQEVDDFVESFPPICWCAIYTRQSRTPNDDYSSCEAQFDACLNFLRSRISQRWICNGRRYDDVAESSETLNRPGLQRLLQDILDGRIDRVVIHRLDRISRRLLDWTEFLQLLRDRQIPLTIVTQPEIGLTAQDAFFLNIMASVAEFEQEMTRERMADARAALKLRGRRVAGMVPYGYQADPVTKQLVIVRREAKRVGKMFQWAAEGVTPRELAEKATKRRWRTRKQISKQGRVTGGGWWTPRQILDTLSNPVYAGLIRDGDRTRPGIHESIVDPILFDQVQKIIASRRTRTPGRETRIPFPLRGILRCGQCGRLMSPSVSGYRNFRYRYYRCRSDAGGKPPCKSVSLPAQEIEDFVIRAVQNSDAWESQATLDQNVLDVVQEFFDGWPKLSSRMQSEVLPKLVQQVTYNARRSVITVELDPQAIVAYLQASPAWV